VWVMRGGWDESLRACGDAGTATDAVNARRIAGETRERSRTAEVFMGPSLKWPGVSAIGYLGVIRDRKVEFARSLAYGISDCFGHQLGM
jgi:hypothetical protein